MTGRELRKQRREAERKARKLEYRQNRLAAAATAPAPKMCGAGSLAGKPGGALWARPALPVTFPSAAKSGPTGPRSAEGKAISSGNFLKHGLASGRIIIAGEDPDAFETLLAGLTAEHAPATETEQLLVKQMAQSWWLMQRALRLQTEAFTGMEVDIHVGAVACPARSEFVSQPRGQTQPEIGFVSQKSTISASCSPSGEL